MEYVCSHLFQTLLGIDFKLYSHTDSESTEYDICYSKEKLGNGLHIVPTQLLFESNIRRQEITFGDWEGFTTLFVSKGEIPFDLFAASFFLLSRYEEYYSTEKDQHGRFLAEKSIAYQKKFLKRLDIS